MNFLGQEDSYLVHRLSEGGTVFHDLGNLSSTFIVGAEDYDVSQQLDVILEAVRSLEIHTKKTGHDDTAVEGYKFSGNAFYRTGGGCYHRDTILIRTDGKNMSRYSSVSKGKLASKDVTSVKSRATNLYEFKPDITLEEVEVALVEVLSRVYGRPAVRMKKEELFQPEIGVLTEEFASQQWGYGRRIPSGYKMEKRFPWSNIQIQLHVDEDVIQNMNIFSDTMDQEMFEVLTKQLKDCSYAEEDVCAAVEAVGPGVFQAEEHIGTDIPRSHQIKEDIRALVREPLQTQNINGGEVEFVWLTYLVWW